MQCSHSAMPSAARLVNMSTYPNNPRPRAWSGTDDNALVNFASAAAKPAMGSLALPTSARANPMRARRHCRDRRRARDQKGCAIAPHCRGSHAYCTKPNPESRGRASRDSGPVGIRGLFRASRLGRGELGVERVRQARDDFVLHVEEIGQGLIEPLGPEMTAQHGSWCQETRTTSA
jgi:hypothetical protein